MGAADYQRPPLLGPAGAYLQPVLHRDNLEVRADTRVCRILFTGSRAVECMGGEILAADQIILCDNAIGSTQLLMLSGIGPAADLEVWPRTAGLAALVHGPVMLQRSWYTSGWRCATALLWSVN